MWLIAEMRARKYEKNARRTRSCENSTQNAVSAAL